MVTPVKVLKKWSLFEGDKVIWMILFFLGMISIIEVYSASSNMSYKTGYYWKPILQHASYFVVGVLATILVHKIPCRYFKLIPLAGIPLSVFLLGIYMFARRVGGAGGPNRGGARGGLMACQGAANRHRTVRGLCICE